MKLLISQTTIRLMVEKWHIIMNLIKRSSPYIHYDTIYILYPHSITGIMVASMLVHLALTALEEIWQGLQGKAQLAVSLLQGIETNYQIYGFQNQYSAYFAITFLLSISWWSVLSVKQYPIQHNDRVSGKTFIRYAQSP